MSQTEQQLSVNQWGEFDEGCFCGSGDFFTVVKKNGAWEEIEPVVQWEGWACANCCRVYDDKGKLIEHPENVKFLS